MIVFDFGKQVADMKPVHGVNNGPVTSSFMRDASELFKRAGIPYSRLHDTEGAYGAGQFVDIPCIFKNFDADPDDEKSYDFFMTDKYIEAIRNVGTKVIYRLGVTIENGPQKKHIYPPKDYRKWARICEGIIRHYTEGWANGYTDAVEYFEIWNEPEFLNHMWIGEYKDFYELFKSTIIYLKEKFPNVKIGGPADGLTSGEFTKGFFDYLTSGERAPLDFYSWHTYFVNIDQLKTRVEAVRRMLDSYGYTNAESICTEWNFVDDWSNMKDCYELIYDNRGASFAAAALCEFQKAPIKTATYYDAQFKAKFNGLFKLARHNGHDDIHGLAPRYTYYAFEKYNELYKIGKEYFSECEDRDISVLCASNGEHAAAIIARFNKVCTNKKQIKLDISNAPSCVSKVYRLDKESESMRLLSICYELDEIELENYDLLYIEWDKSFDSAWGTDVISVNGR